MKVVSTKAVISDLFALAIKEQTTRSRKQRQIVRMRAGKVRRVLTIRNNESKKR